PGERADPFSVLAAGFYDYRTGGFDAAIERLRPMTEESGNNPDQAVRRALAGVIRAMALFRLGRVEDGRRQLAMADALATQMGSDGPRRGPLPWHWNDWLRYDVLRREADGVLRDASFPDDPFAP